MLAIELCQGPNFPGGLVDFGHIANMGTPTVGHLTKLSRQFRGLLGLGRINRLAFLDGFDHVDVFDGHRIDF